MFTAAFLAEIERMTGKRVADHFDLIAGTSKGGIIGIGLGMGLSAAEILNFYLKHGPSIFHSVGVHVRTWRWLAALAALWQTRRRTPLGIALHEVFVAGNAESGERRLGPARI